MSRDRKVVRVGSCLECPFAVPPKLRTSTREICWHPSITYGDLEQTDLAYVPRDCPLRTTSVLVEHGVTS